MKTKYLQFLNEELKHLPPPSDDETHAALKGMTFQEKMKAIKKNNLGEEFYPTKEEINKTALFKKGDLVFDRFMGNGLVGLIISDKYINPEEFDFDDDYTGGYDVYFRGMGGEKHHESESFITKLPFDEINNADMDAYISIAKRKGYKINIPEDYEN